MNVRNDSTSTSTAVAEGGQAPADKSKGKTLGEFLNYAKEQKIELSTSELTDIFISNNDSDNTLDPTEWGNAVAEARGRGKSPNDNESRSDTERTGPGNDSESTSQSNESKVIPEKQREQMRQAYNGPSEDRDAPAAPILIEYFDAVSQGGLMNEDAKTAVKFLTHIQNTNIAFGDVTREAHDGILAILTDGYQLEPGALEAEAESIFGADWKDQVSMGELEQIAASMSRELGTTPQSVVTGATTGPGENQDADGGAVTVSTDGMVRLPGSEPEDNPTASTMPDTPETLQTALDNGETFPGLGPYQDLLHEYDMLLGKTGLTISELSPAAQANAPNSIAFYYGLSKEELLSFAENEWGPEWQSSRTMGELELLAQRHPNAEPVAGEWDQASDGWEPLGSESSNEDSSDTRTSSSSAASTTSPGSQSTGPGEYTSTGSDSGARSSTNSSSGSGSSNSSSGSGSSNSSSGSASSNSSSGSGSSNSSSGSGSSNSSSGSGSSTAANTGGSSGNVNSEPDSAQAAESPAPTPATSNGDSSASSNTGPSSAGSSNGPADYSDRVTFSDGSSNSGATSSPDTADYSDRIDSDQREVTDYDSSTSNGPALTGDHSSSSSRSEPMTIEDFIDTYGDQFDSPESAEVFFESFLDGVGLAEEGEVPADMAENVTMLMDQLAAQYDEQIPGSEVEALGTGLGQSYDEMMGSATGEPTQATTTDSGDIDTNAETGSEQTSVAPSPEQGEGPDGASGVDADHFALHNSDRFGGSEEDAAQFYRDFAERNGVDEGETLSNSQLSDLQREARAFATENGFNAAPHAPGQTAANPDMAKPDDDGAASTGDMGAATSADSAASTGSDTGAPASASTSAEAFAEKYSDSFESSDDAIAFYENFKTAAGVPEGEDIDPAMAVALDEMVPKLAAEVGGQMGGDLAATRGTQFGEMYANVQAQGGAGSSSQSVTSESGQPPSDPTNAVGLATQMGNGEV